ncbi:MAG: sigma54-dependent response regulator, two-component [Rhodocyclaceae bacterium]|nr:sigma54-dependent response regulator, two-component [Rhodocyclaceae bacterium]
MGNTILVVEDDEILAGNVCTYLERKGWEAERCGSAEEALARVESLRPAGVVADQTLPRMTGIDMLQRVLEIDPGVKVIMLTGDGRAQTAVQAMKAGAWDYLTKPFAMAELHARLEQALGPGAREPAPPPPRARPAGTGGLAALLGDSPAMAELGATIRQVLAAERRMADGQLPAVLVQGETGTGKELVARALHFDGARRDRPFVEVNCASIPAHLLEAELFGHEKGAFTDAKERKPGLVEAADGGTLFLDEIGEIEPGLQAKLLKLLEEKTIRRIGAVKERRVDLRIISATNRDLEQMVRDGKFRSDLFFRLRIIAIKVPSLRERGGDILLLARHFLEVHGRRYGKPGLSFSPEAEQVLMGYYWPGNVRELRNMLEQTVLLASRDTITPDQLALCPGLAPGGGEGNFEDQEGGSQPLPRQRANLAAAEKALVVKTLERTGWNVTRSARLLGISRDMLRYRIEKLALARPRLSH